MRKLLELIRGIYWTMREENALDKIAKSYRHDPLPRASALEEVALRAYLEEFRDFASEQYLADRLALDDIRKEWADTRLKPLWKSLGRKKTAALRKAVMNMPAVEMFHADAHTAYVAEGERLRQKYQATTLKTHGPSRMTKHQRRVLRSI